MVGRILTRELLTCDESVKAYTHSFVTSGSHAWCAVEKEAIKQNDDAVIAPRYRSVFTVDPDTGRITLDIALPDGAALYGFGMHCKGWPIKPNSSLSFFNRDPTEYSEESENIYQSLPYVVVREADGFCVAILVDCVEKGRVNYYEKTLTFTFISDEMHAIFIETDTLEALAKQTRTLIGAAKPLPAFALGFQQCRWGYKTRAEVEDVAVKFRALQFPCDGIWLDIDHMHARQSFTWDTERFPEPQQFIAGLNEANFSVVAIQNPGVITSDDNPRFVSATAQNLLLKDNKGEPLTGTVWPGECCFPDFSMPETRAWWSGCVQEWLSVGLSGVWNDMNEPSIFDNEKNSIPFLEENAPHIQNTYGFYMCQATLDAQRKSPGFKRPFILTRSSFLGGQRYASTWTGDNHASWQDLRWSIQMILQMGVCGQPFVGADIGGFLSAPTEELFLRWFQLGVFYPIMRVHSSREVPAREPWCWSFDAQDIIRTQLEKRMRLLPYLMSTMMEASVSGQAMVRPIFCLNQQDARLSQTGDAFLLGESFAVYPVTEAGQETREVYVPRGCVLYGWENESRLTEGLHQVSINRLEIPVYVKGGVAVLLSKGGQHTQESLNNDIELHLYPDVDGKFESRMYFDMGSSIESWEDDAVERYAKSVEFTISGHVKREAIQGSASSESNIAEYFDAEIKACLSGGCQALLQKNVVVVLHYLDGGSLPVREGTMQDVFSGEGIDILLSNYSKKV